MDDDVIVRSVLIFFGSLPVALLAGWLAGRRVFERGLVAGLSLIGIAGLAAALNLWWNGIRPLESGAVRIDGEFVRFDTGSAERTGSPADDAHRPVVRFVAPDGRTHEVHGLGGGLRDLEPGAVVTLLVPADDPSRAVIDDFQNRWGGVYAFGLFGGVPLLMASFVAALYGESRSDTAARGNRHVAARRPSARRARSDRPTTALSRRCLYAGHLLFVGGFVLMLAIEPVLRGLGAGFTAVALAMVSYAGSLAFTRPRQRGSAWSLAALGLMFSAFGLGALALG